MGKSRDTKKDVKKKPSKTFKEKRKEKQEKKKGLGIKIDTWLKEKLREALGAYQKLFEITSNSIYEHPKLMIT